MSWTAKDVMHREVGLVEASASLADLERSFAEAKVSGFPVVQRGRVVGVISRTDVIERLGRESSTDASTYYTEHGPHRSGPVRTTFEEIVSESGGTIEALRVQDLMTPVIVAVGPDDSLATVARRLSEQHVHRVLVVDDGQLVGIVSSLDLVRLVAEGRLRSVD